MTDHPSPFTAQLIRDIQPLVPPGEYPRVLDPFAGIGGIHRLANTTVGIELEPEWAWQHPDTIVGNALHLPFDNSEFDAIVTSPTFGNRMADHHDAKDGTVRNTYKHKLGRDLSADNSGAMQWGDEYRDFHVRAWKEATRVTKQGGRFVLHVKNHIRKGEEQHVAEWHLSTLIGIGWVLKEWVILNSKGLKFGANRDLRTRHEYLMVLDR